MRRWPIRRILLSTLVLLLLGSESARAQWHGNGAPVCSAAGNQINPGIVTDGQGGAIVTWLDHRGFNYDIYAQRVNANGVSQWTPNGVPICTANGNHDQPVIVSDDAGGAIIAWKDHRGSNYDIYAQRVDASGTALWTTDGEVVCNYNGEHDYPAIASNGSQGAIIAWVDYRSGTAAIYAQDMDAAGAAQWTAQGIGVPNEANLHFPPRIVATGFGGAIITWGDDRNSSIDIFAQSVANGHTEWNSFTTAYGAPICTAANDQNDWQVVSNGNGGAIVCWDDGRNGLPDIYAQDVLFINGDPQWTLNGSLLCNAGSTQSNPQLVADGLGGATVVWQDYRSLAGYDIYAMHVKSSGSISDPGWVGNGTPLCTASNDQTDPQVVSDGAGGVIAVWQDYRSGNSDLYVRRVEISGAVDWTDNGVPVCVAANDQINPRIAPDGVGGAIVVWQDLRNGSDDDIYVQRVSPAGVVTAVTPTRATALTLRPLHPNPTRAGTSASFELPVPARVSAGVWDLAGRRVRDLAADQIYPSGRHDLTWDGANDAGARVDAGLYWIRLSAPGFSATRRVTVLR